MFLIWITDAVPIRDIHVGKYVVSVGVMCIIVLLELCDAFVGKSIIAVSIGLLFLNIVN